jgi:hypothetical protein
MGRTGTQAFSGIAQSAQQATQAIGSTFQVMGQISNLARRSTTGLSAADKQVSKLATDFITLRDSMRAIKAGGFLVDDANVRRASTLLTQLQTAANLSADQVDNLKRKLDAEFGSGFRIDEAFRSLPQRLAKMSQEAANLSQRAFGGGFRTSAGELGALDKLNNKLLELQRNGVDVSADLARVANAINQVSAAAARTKGMDALNRQFQRLDAALGKQGGMTRSRITQLNDTIKAMQALGGVGAGADPRITRMGPIIEAQFRALPGAIDPAIQKMRDFTASMREQMNLANQFQTPVPSARNLVNAFDQSLRVLKTPGLNPAIYQEAAQNARAFADQLGRFPAGLNETARAFGTHARRIAEGILLYDAFGRAIQAVANEIKLVGDLAREQIRFEAVVGDLGAGGDSRFLAGIGEVAVRTNTQLADLASIMDSVAFATDRASSAAEREAESLQIMGRIGEFTNVTQRDLLTETENLIGIMNTFGLTLEDWEDHLGGIVVMGDNSSRAIQAIVDTLSGAGRAAVAAGVDIDTLGAIGVEMFRRLQGSMSGSEIASQLNTIFGKLADTSVQQDIEELTGGIIRFRDETGALRDGAVVYEELFTLLGQVNDEAKATILDKFIPPLNPGARSFVEIMIDTLPNALETSGRGAAATAEELSKLSELLVSGPAEQFSKAIIALQTAFTELFREDIAGGMNAIATAIKTIADFIGTDFGRDIGGVTIKLIAFFALLRGAGVAARGLEILFLGSGRRIRELETAMAGAGIAGDTFAAGARNAGTQATNAAGRIDRMKDSARNLAGALAKPFLFLIAFEIVTSIPDIVDAFKAQLNQELSSGVVDRGTLDAAFGELTNIDVLGVDLTSIARLDFIFGNAAAQARGLSEIQFQNVENLAQAMIRLEKEGKLTAAAQRVLDEAVAGADGKISNQLVTVDELLNAYNQSILSADTFGDSQDRSTDSTDRLGDSVSDLTVDIDALTAAEQRAADATRLNLGLSGLRAQEMLRLTQQLREGAITVDEFSEAQDNLGSATEAVAQFIAAYGSNLSVIPGLQERMASSGASAAEALTRMLLENPDTITERIGILEQMVEFAEVAEETATTVEQNPITPRIDTGPLSEDAKVSDYLITAVAQGWVTLTDVVNKKPVKPALDLAALKSQAIAALNMYRTLLGAQSLFERSIGRLSLFKGFRNQFSARTSQAGSELKALEAAIRQLETAGSSLGAAGEELSGLGDAFDVLGGISGSDPRLGTSKETQQTGIIDIGTLSPSVVAQIVAMATAAQNRIIAAGGTVDTDEQVALFKDAEFLRLISGVDQRLLQQAIEELTEVEQRRLELEQARLQDVTRSIITQVGPIQSMVSAPVLAAGGGLLSGQGLNADPRLGNFVINVPINWTGMDLQQLQQFIYASVAQAWIDAGRGG